MIFYKKSRTFRTHACLAFQDYIQHTFKVYRNKDQQNYEKIIRT